jgi:hypothetical protein
MVKKMYEVTPNVSENKQKVTYSDSVFVSCSQYPMFHLAGKNTKLSLIDCIIY